MTLGSTGSRYPLSSIQVKRPQCRDVKRITQGHTGGKWQGCLVAIPAPWFLQRQPLCIYGPPPLDADVGCDPVPSSSDSATMETFVKGEERDT